MCPNMPLGTAFNVMNNMWLQVREHENIDAFLVPKDGYVFPQQTVQNNITFAPGHTHTCVGVVGCCTHVLLVILFKTTVFHNFTDILNNNLYAFQPEKIFWEKCSDVKYLKNMDLVQDARTVYTRLQGFLATDMQCNKILTILAKHKQNSDVWFDSWQWVVNDLGFVQKALSPTHTRNFVHAITQYQTGVKIIPAIRRDLSLDLHLDAHQQRVLDLKIIFVLILVVLVDHNPIYMHQCYHTILQLGVTVPHCFMLRCYTERYCSGTDPTHLVVISVPIVGI